MLLDGGSGTDALMKPLSPHLLLRYRRISYIEASHQSLSGVTV